MLDQRREFIKKSALLGLSLGIEPSFPWSTNVGSVNENSSKKLAKAATLWGFSWAFIVFLM